MHRQCEICQSLGTENAEPDPKRAPATRVRRVRVGDRILAVCDRHAEAIGRAGCASLEQVRELFREQLGSRSLVPRRARLDRRVFPPRPEGRRCSDGRRASDGEG